MKSEHLLSWGLIANVLKIEAAACPGEGVIGTEQVPLGSFRWRGLKYYTSRLGKQSSGMAAVEAAKLH